jgi:hypothetical protein
MRSAISLSLTVLAILFLTFTPAFGWGAATHTYLANELGSQHGSVNLHEMYGAVLPDMFNLMFGHPYQDYLWNETHYEFMKVVEKAKTGEKKALAYGFASHNEAWGADYTAHIGAMAAQGNGYVVAKAGLLTDFIEDMIESFLLSYSIPNASQIAQQLAPTVAENAVESAVDYWVSRIEDSNVGMRMVLAANSRGPFVPALIRQAFAKDFSKATGVKMKEAAGLIIDAEEQFREYMVLYGGILTQPNAIELMAQQGADLATLMLAEYGVAAEVDPTLLEMSLLAAIAIVELDYSAELSATLSNVASELESHGIDSASF